MAERLAALKRRLHADGVPAGQRLAELLAELLAPGPDDYFVLKPKHSGFFSTTLDTLLEYLKSRTLIITGLTADNCVLLPAHTRQALEHMRRALKAEVTPSPALEFNRAA